jgi:hypothetical protein
MFVLCKESAGFELLGNTVIGVYTTFERAREETIKAASQLSHVKQQADFEVRLYEQEQDEDVDMDATHWSTLQCEPAGKCFDHHLLITCTSLADYETMERKVLIEEEEQYATQLEQRRVTNTDAEMVAHRAHAFRDLHQLY